MLRFIYIVYLVEYTTYTLGGATLISDPNDGVLWDATYELDNSFDVDGRSRIFHVAYPNNHIYENSPALLHFHGGFGDGATSAESTGYSDIACNKGFLVVYGVGDFRKWSGGACCGACSTNADDPCYVDDVAYTEGVLTALKEEQLINTTSRVFASGHSNGGYMAYRLSCEMRDQIDGIASVAASSGYYNADECLYGCDNDKTLCYDTSKEHCSESSWKASLPSYYNCDVDSPLPVITLQGYEDWHIPVDGGKCIECYGNMSIIPYSFEVEENANMNACNVDIPAKLSFHNVSTSDSNDISECWTYQGCESNTTYCIQQIGGHAWPGNIYPTCDINSPDYDPQGCADTIEDMGPQIESLHASVVIVDYFESLMITSEDGSDSSSSGSDDDINIVIVISITLCSVFFIIALICIVFRLFRNRGKDPNDPTLRLTEITKN